MGKALLFSLVAAALTAGTAGCAAPARAYVWNDSPTQVQVTWVTGNTFWSYRLLPGEAVSAVTDASCELRDLSWAGSPGGGGLERLCPGQVWTIRSDREDVGPVPDSWAASPPPRVNTAPPR